MLKKIFTWWNGATIGALFDINRRAKFVGEDEMGNRFYEEPKATIEGRNRRYVIYKSYAEPSLVNADWHGWLHYTFELPPTKEPFKIKSWEQPHRANLTGTVFAYRPKGSLTHIKDAKANSSLDNNDYEAWVP